VTPPHRSQPSIYTSAATQARRRGRAAG
jgi:hypothetical protein